MEMKQSWTKCFIGSVIQGAVGEAKSKGMIPNIMLINV